MQKTLIGTSFDRLSMVVEEKVLVITSVNGDLNGLQISQTLWTFLGGN